MITFFLFFSLNAVDARPPRAARLFHDPLAMGIPGVLLYGLQLWAIVVLVQPVAEAEAPLAGCTCPDDGGRAAGARLFLAGRHDD